MEATPRAHWAMVIYYFASATSLVFNNNNNLLLLMIFFMASVHQRVMVDIAAIPTGGAFTLVGLVPWKFTKKCKSQSQSWSQIYP